MSSSLIHVIESDCGHEKNFVDVGVQVDFTIPAPRHQPFVDLGEFLLPLYVVRVVRVVLLLYTLRVVLYNICYIIGLYIMYVLSKYKVRIHRANSGEKTGSSL